MSNCDYPACMMGGGHCPDEAECDAEEQNPKLYSTQSSNDYDRHRNVVSNQYRIFEAIQAMRLEMRILASRLTPPPPRGGDEGEKS